MRDRFIRMQTKELSEGPLTMERIEKALHAAWSHGASTALLMPAFAYSKIGQPRRKAFARMLLGIFAVNSYQDQGIEPFHDNELSEFVDRQMEREEIIPLISGPPEPLGRVPENSGLSCPLEN